VASYHAFGRTKATHPFMTAQAAAGEYAILRRAQYFKESATAGVVERATVSRYNSAGVTPADHTVALNTRSPAARVPGQEWGTAPAIVGNPLVMTDVGDKPAHRNSWRPPRPYAGIYLINAEEVGIDATSVANTSTDYALAWSEHDPGLEQRSVRGRRPRRAYWHFHTRYCSMNAGSATKPFQRYDANYCIELRRYSRADQPTGRSRYSPPGRAATRPRLEHGRERRILGLVLARRRPRRCRRRGRVLRPRDARRPGRRGGV
jgi:hypothetical protein